MAGPESNARRSDAPDRGPGISRREIVRRGLKLAFVAPVISTFFAKDAYAAQYSCYPVGHACGGAGQEPCCGTACSGGVCPP